MGFDLLRARGELFSVGSGLPPSCSNFTRLSRFVRLAPVSALRIGRARLDIATTMDARDQHFHLASNAFWREARKNLEDPGEEDALRADVNTFFESFPTPSKHNAVVNLLTLFSRFSEENLSTDAPRAG